MRIGWDEDHIFAIENAKAVERAGGQAVAVHGAHEYKCMKEKRIGILLNK